MSRRLQFVVIVALVAVLAVIVFHPWVNSAHALLRSQHVGHLAAMVLAALPGPPAPCGIALSASVNFCSGHNTAQLLDLICVRLC